MMQHVAASVSPVAAEPGNSQPSSNPSQGDGFAAFFESSQSEVQRSSRSSRDERPADSDAYSKEPARPEQQQEAKTSSNDKPDSQTPDKGPSQRDAQTPDSERQNDRLDAESNEAGAEKTDRPASNSEKSDAKESQALQGEAKETLAAVDGEDEAVAEAGESIVPELDEASLLSVLQQLKVKDEPIKVQPADEAKEPELTDLRLQQLAQSYQQGNSQSESDNESKQPTQLVLETLAADIQSSDEKSADVVAIDDLKEVEAPLINTLSPEEINAQQVLALGTEEEAIIKDTDLKEIATVVEKTDLGAEKAVLPVGVKADETPADLAKLSELVSALDRLPGADQEQLQQVLQQGLEQATNAEQPRLNQWLSQLNQLLKQVSGDVDSQGSQKDFVASLKSALQEAANQLSQGHVAGIDLDSIAKELTAQWSDKGQLPQTDIQRLQQALAQVTPQDRHVQAQQSSEAADVALNSAVSAEEPLARQIEQRSQQQVLNERPVNITRNEGLRQLADKVNVMVNQKNMTAEIRIDPPDLGAMKINIAMAGEQATVNFTVQSQQARDALQQGESQLRDMLQEQGIQLGQSSVEQGEGQQGQEGEKGQLASSQSQVEEGNEDDANTQTVRVTRPGGIDFFA